MKKSYTKLSPNLTPKYPQILYQNIPKFCIKIFPNLTPKYPQILHQNIPKSYTNDTLKKKSHTALRLDTKVTLSYTYDSYISLEYMWNIH